MRIHTELRALSARELESLLRRLVLTEKKMKDEGLDSGEEKPKDSSWIWNKEK